MDQIAAIERALVQTSIGSDFTELTDVTAVGVFRLEPPLLRFFFFWAD